MGLLLQNKKIKDLDMSSSISESIINLKEKRIYTSIRMDKRGFLSLKEDYKCLYTFFMPILFKFGI